MNIIGYRTNADHTETLAWEERADGSVFCDHDGAQACAGCVEADERIAVVGNAVRIVAWPANLVRDGRTVTHRG